MKTLRTNLLPTLGLTINLWLVVLTLTYCTENTSDKEDKTTENDYEIIATYFKEQQHYVLTDSIKTIFVLTDIGCMPCNKHFSELMTNHLNDSSSVFLILASGVNIDLSNYMTSKSKIFYDRPENIKNNMLKQSKTIFIKQHQVDTSIIIDARQIEYQFNIINERLTQ